MARLLFSILQTIDGHATLLTLHPWSWNHPGNKSNQATDTRSTSTSRHFPFPPFTITRNAHQKKKRRFDSRVPLLPRHKRAMRSKLPVAILSPKGLLNASEIRVAPKPYQTIGCEEWLSGSFSYPPRFHEAYRPIGIVAVEILRPNSYRTLKNKKVRSLSRLLDVSFKENITTPL